MKKMSRAQEMSLNLFAGAMGLALIACFMVPFLVSFGGAYNNASEFIALMLQLCWLIVSRLAIVASIPFIITTFIKGLF